MPPKNKILREPSPAITKSTEEPLNGVLVSTLFGGRLKMVRRLLDSQSADN
jgi:hypothetical protein